MVVTHAPTDLDRMIHDVWFDVVTLELRFRDLTERALPQPVPASDATSEGAPLTVMAVPEREEDWLRAYA